MITSIGPNGLSSKPDMSLQTIIEFFLCYIHVFCWYMNTFLTVFPPYLQSAIEYCIDPGT